MPLTVRVVEREGVWLAVAQAVPLRLTVGVGEREALAVPLRAPVADGVALGETLKQAVGV